MALSGDGATVVVGAGARLGPLYHAVARGAPGKAVVGGTCSPVGVGGLILGTPAPPGGLPNLLSSSIALV